MRNLVSHFMESYKGGKIMGKFEDLKVWQRSKDLAVFIYKVTARGQFSKDYGLRDQIRRASVSVPSNTCPVK